MLFASFSQEQTHSDPKVDIIDNCEIREGSMYYIYCYFTDDEGTKEREFVGRRLSNKILARAFRTRQSELRVFHLFSDLGQIAQDNDTSRIPPDYI